MHIESTAPRVIEIEQILKTKYGCKFVSFKDDIDLAEQTLKAYEVAYKSGVNLPENIIVSDFMATLGEHVGATKTILLSSQNARANSKIITKKALQNYTKTELEILKDMHFLPNTSQFSNSLSEHVVLHEIMHGTHLPLNAFANKKIPAKFMSTKDNLSLYSALSKTHETFTELATKKSLIGLNADETRLLEYLS